MVQESERHRQEDEKRREEVELRNNTDSLIYQAEKLLRDQGDKIPADVKGSVEEKINACRSAMQGEDMDELQRQSQALAQALQQVGSSMYEQPGAPASDEVDEPPPSGDEDVVEGEFSEI